MSLSGVESAFKVRFESRPERSVLLLSFTTTIVPLIPGVDCRIIRNFTDLLKFENAARNSAAPMVAVIGKDAAKLGFGV